MGSTGSIMPSHLPFAAMVDLFELLIKSKDKKKMILLSQFRQQLKRPSGELFHVYRLLLPQVMTSCLEMTLIPELPAPLTNFSAACVISSFF
jgi:hypothetical protein